MDIGIVRIVRRRVEIVVRQRPCRSRIAPNPRANSAMTPEMPRPTLRRDSLAGINEDVKFRTRTTNVLFLASNY